MATAASSLVKIVALCGSLHQASFHRGLINAAIKLVQKFSISRIQTQLDEMDSLTFFNIDLVVDRKYPLAVGAFCQKV